MKLSRIKTAHKFGVILGVKSHPQRQFGKILNQNNVLAILHPHNRNYNIMLF